MTKSICQWALVLFLFNPPADALAHPAREDGHGCHYEQAQRHCHGEDGDVLELIGAIALVAAAGYVLCKWMRLCDAPTEKQWPDDAVDFSDGLLR